MFRQVVENKAVSKHQIPGAKKAKKLEFNKRSEFIIGAENATMYRALLARCNYPAQDRPDIGFASKKLCKDFSTPNLNSFKILKRLARYLAGLPRLVYHYKWQDTPE